MMIEEVEEAIPTSRTITTLASGHELIENENGLHIREPGHQHALHANWVPQDYIAGLLLNEVKRLQTLTNPLKHRNSLASFSLVD